MFAEQVFIFQEGFFACRTGIYFPGVDFPVHPIDYNFPEKYVCSSNRCQHSLLFEQQELNIIPFLLLLNIVRKIGNFQEGTPVEQIFQQIGLGGYFLDFVTSTFSELLPCSS